MDGSPANGAIQRGRNTDNEKLGVGDSPDDAASEPVVDVKKRHRQQQQTDRVDSKRQRNDPDLSSVGDNNEMYEAVAVGRDYDGILFDRLESSAASVASNLDEAESVGNGRPTSHQKRKGVATAQRRTSRATAGVKEWGDIVSFERKKPQKKKIAHVPGIDAWRDSGGGGGGGERSDTNPRPADVAGSDDAVTHSSFRARSDSHSSMDTGLGGGEELGHQQRKAKREVYRQRARTTPSLVDSRSLTSAVFCGQLSGGGQIDADPSTSSSLLPAALISNIHIRAARLAAALHGRLRNWVTAEFAYSSIDRGFFLRNEFVECLAALDAGRVTALTRTEWAVLRSKLGQPRLLSAAFLTQERAKLERYREDVRRIQVGLSPVASIALDGPFVYQVPLPLTPGCRVTAAHPITRQLSQGTIVGSGLQVHALPIQQPQRRSKLDRDRHARHTMGMCGGTRAYYCVQFDSDIGSSSSSSSGSCNSRALGSDTACDHDRERRFSAALAEFEDCKLRLEQAQAEKCIVTKHLQSNESGTNGKLDNAADLDAQGGITATADTIAHIDRYVLKFARENPWLYEERVTRFVNTMRTHMQQLLEEFPALQRPVSVGGTSASPLSAPGAPLPRAAAVDEALAAVVSGGAAVYRVADFDVISHGPIQLMYPAVAVHGAPTAAPIDPRPTAPVSHAAPAASTTASAAKVPIHHDAAGANGADASSNHVQDSGTSAVSDVTTLNPPTLTESSSSPSSAPSASRATATTAVPVLAVPSVSAKLVVRHPSSPQRGQQLPQQQQQGVQPRRAYPTSSSSGQKGSDLAINEAWAPVRTASSTSSGARRDASEAGGSGVVNSNVEGGPARADSHRADNASHAADSATRESGCAPFVPWDPWVIGTDSSSPGPDAAVLLPSAETVDSLYRAAAWSDAGESSDDAGPIPSYPRVDGRGQLEFGGAVFPAWGRPLRMPLNASADLCLGLFPTSVWAPRERSDGKSEIGAHTGTGDVPMSWPRIRQSPLLTAATSSFAPGEPEPTVGGSSSVLMDEEACSNSSSVMLSGAAHVLHSSTSGTSSRGTDCIAGSSPSVLATAAACYNMSLMAMCRSDCVRVAAALRGLVERKHVLLNEVARLTAAAAATAAATAAAVAAATAATVASASLSSVEVPIALVAPPSPLPTLAPQASVHEIDAAAAPAASASVIAQLLPCADDVSALKSSITDDAATASVSSPAPGAAAAATSSSSAARVALSPATGLSEETKAALVWLRSALLATDESIGIHWRALDRLRKRHDNAADMTQSGMGIPLEVGAPPLPKATIRRLQNQVLNGNPGGYFTRTALQPPSSACSSVAAAPQCRSINGKSINLALLAAAWSASPSTTSQLGAERGVAPRVAAVRELSIARTAPAPEGVTSAAAASVDAIETLASATGVSGVRGTSSFPNNPIMLSKAADVLTTLQAVATLQHAPGALPLRDTLAICDAALAPLATHAHASNADLVAEVEAAFLHLRALAMRPRA